MSGIDAPQGTPESGQIEAVAQWRSAVELFFENEWEQLRTLILELEVDQWDATALPAAAGQTMTSVSEQNSDPERLLNRNNSNDQPDGNPHDGGGAVSLPESSGLAVGQDSNRQDRLAELAENLERRLRSSDSLPTSTAGV